MFSVAFFSRDVYKRQVYPVVMFLRVLTAQIFILFAL